MHRDGFAVRIAGKGEDHPNIEMKFKKDDFDRYAMKMANVVTFEDIQFSLSPHRVADCVQTLSREATRILRMRSISGVLFEEKQDDDLLRTFMRGCMCRGAVGITV